MHFDGKRMSQNPDKLKLVLEANRIISSTLNTPELLRQVMRLATEVVGAESSSILLYDAKTDELYFDLALGENESELKTIRLKAGEGIAGWVAKNRKTQVVNDVATDPRWVKHTDQKIKFRTRSIIAAPLVYKNELLGVVEAINKRDGHFSAEEDAGILEAFAAQAAVSIENARIFESLQEAKEKVEAVFSQMSDGAVLVDGKGSKIFFNESAGKLLGSENTSKGTAAEIFGGFEHNPPITDIMAAGAKKTSFEFKRAEPKTLYVSGTATKIFNSTGVIGSIFIFGDVTEEKKESLVKRNFLSLISHKLKTPLVTITGYGPLLLDDPALSDFQRKAIQTITKQGNYLQSLVEKLLNFTLIDDEGPAADKAEGSLMKTAVQAVSSLENYLEDKDAVVIIRDELKGIPSIIMDERKVEASLKNIIENAVKFNNGKEKNVEIGPVKSEGFVGIYIKDNGPGIPPEERERIFQKFYQIEESFTGQVEGAGLGLALVKQIIEAHGGKIVLESSVGIGSTFNLLFPARGE